jgi:hypothetical protein
MVMYGGAGSCLTNMQILTALDAAWQPGPPLYQNATTAYQSGLQVIPLSSSARGQCYDPYFRRLVADFQRKNWHFSLAISSYGKNYPRIAVI